MVMHFLYGGVGQLNTWWAAVRAALADSSYQKIKGSSIDSFFPSDGPAPISIASGSSRPDGVEHQFRCGDSMTGIESYTQILIH